jgi:nucleoid DNA-binding protein
MRKGKLCVGREEMFKTVSKRTGLTWPESRAAVYVTFEYLLECLQAGRNVRLGYAGVLKNKYWKARPIYSIKAKTVKMAKHDVRIVKFEPSDELKKRIRIQDAPAHAEAEGVAEGVAEVKPL